MRGERPPWMLGSGGRLAALEMVDRVAKQSLPRVSRPGALAEGLIAGLALAAFDGLATGVGRVPAGFLALVLAWGLVSGLLAGGLAALTRRRGVALGLVVLGSGSLHAVSILTRSLDVSPSSAGGLATLAASLLLVASAAGLAARSLVRVGGWTWPAVVLAAIPGSSLLLEAISPSPWALVLTSALPLIAALAWGLPLPSWSGPATLPLAVVALAVPAVFAEGGASERRSVGPASARAPEECPSMVLVVVDTLRWDHARPQGDGAAAGALARLAREGVRFDQAVSSAAWTLPSMASLLTSQHPSHHAAVTKEHRLPEELDTLAEQLHAVGYQTAAFTGGGFMSPAYGLDQGFEVFDHEAEYSFLPLLGHVPLVWRLVRNRWMPQRWVLRYVNEFEGVPRLRRLVSRWLEGRDPERPFLLLVHTYQVHDYYIYQPGPDDPLRAERGGASVPLGESLRVHPQEIVRAGEEVVGWFHEVYRRRIEYVDRELDPLLRQVEAAARPRRLVTVLTSDHGEGFDAARGRVHHGGRLHDDLLRVPLVLSAPGRLEGGRVVSDQVRLLDVLPTLLELAGLPVPQGLSGRSLLPLLAERERELPREAWSEDHLGPRRFSLRSAAWKAMDGPEGEALYRLEVDPQEDHPLEGPLPDGLRALWQDRHRLLEPRGGTESQQDAATLEQLRRLGY